MPSRERVGLLKLMWDLVGTEFAGRQLQYEMFYSAAQHVADLHVFRSFDWSAGRRHVRRAQELSDPARGSGDRPRAKGS